MKRDGLHELIQGIQGNKGSPSDPSPRLPPNRPLPPGPARRLPGQPALPPAHEYARPKYVANFACISSKCEDTCCQGWGVPIDRATYEKYASTESMKPYLGTLVVLNTDRPTNAHFAIIPLKGNATCSFLDAEDQLCGLQKQFGPEMLSSTCAVYPRAVSTIAGQQEEALHLSCPEAARVTLLDTNLLHDHIAANGPDYSALQLNLRRPLPASETVLAIREFVLMLLRDRKYPIWQRLYLLGIFCRRLNALSFEAHHQGSSVAAWCEANPAAVAQLLEDSARVAVLDTLRPAMDEVEPSPEKQLILVMELLRIRFAQPPVPERIVQCIRDFEAGIGSKTAQNEAQLLAAYADGYRLYYKPLMQRNPHILENYLINYVFKNNYPFGRQRPTDAIAPSTEEQERQDPETEHLSLCVLASLTQTILIGMAAHHRESFDSGHIVKVVQSLARTFEHSKESAEQIKQFGRTKELTHPRSMTVLLRHEA